VLERTYPKSPEKVFAAFADPALKRRWYAEGAHQAERFELDFRVGGVERQLFRLGENTPFPGTAITTDGRHEDIVPGRRIVISSTMSLGDRRISTALATFELIPEGGGTRLLLTHQAAYYEGSGGPEMRKEGWEKLLDQLGDRLAE
jgi:uncharacterized protein YndB with AHSA1/START domain